MEIVHELIVCHGCACYLANGDGDPDHADGFAVGIRYWAGFDVVLACGEESNCDGYGWHRCEVCGDEGHGTAHPAVTFARETTAAR
ncbi:hypothetical protein [Asanoa iriomotensis]|uniref:Uncharacterized protein n=1 Tax=Asanoa iriomotensis TaxID=234613 RepID=A0ABQ4CBU3_9ACTN|nr:hypothetical protein [Asanoa iriomotensis]GIF60232.1 hypothetical protein Air01nite_63270 [Asanoa iriomotensis]